MNEMLNKILLAGDKFMQEMHSRQTMHLPIVLEKHLLKTKKEFKNLKKLEI